VNRAEPKPEPALVSACGASVRWGPYVDGVSLLEWSAIEGESPVLPSNARVTSLFARVAQFGNAELIGRYPSAKAKYLPETDSEQVQ
jgi:hypothetical protein